MNKTTTEMLNSQLLALNQLSGLTAREFNDLIRRYQSVDKIFQLANGTISDNELSPSLLKRLGKALDRLAKAEKYVSSLRQREITLLNRFEDSFPDLLSELNDPPPLLFVRGSFPEVGHKNITIVGSSKSSAEGISLAASFTRQFTDRGIVVVSSLSGGIDTTVHLTAASSKRMSCAVLDSGFDSLDSSTEIPVAIDITRRGGIISEYLLNKKQTKHTIAESNRLLVGISHAVVVIEMCSDSSRVKDIVSFCKDIGKLLFFVSDIDKPHFADEVSLAHAIKSGAIMLSGTDQSKNIIQALV